MVVEYENSTAIKHAERRGLGCARHIDLDMFWMRDVFIRGKAYEFTVR